MVLPSHVTPEKFVRVVMTAVQANTDLLTASKQSLFSACMKCAQDGLIPDGREAALVIYHAKDGPIAQYMGMVWGLAKKFRNSGDAASLTAQMVFEHDKFRYWVDDNGEHIEHDPFMFGERGKAIGVYAIAKTKDGSIYIEIMSKDEVMAVRAASKAKYGPWSGPFEFEMWRKTVIRRLCKRLPMSTDVEQVVTRDDELFDLKNLPPANDKSKQLAQMIGIETKPEEEVKAEDVPPIDFESAPS